MLIIAIDQQCTFAYSKYMSMNNQKEEYLTIEEVAKRLKISTMTVYRMARNGQLPAVKIGRVWRISSIKLSQMFDKQNNK